MSNYQLGDTAYCVYCGDAIEAMTTSDVGSCIWLHNGTPDDGGHWYYCRTSTGEYRRSLYRKATPPLELPELTQKEVDKKEDFQPR